MSNENQINLFLAEFNGKKCHIFFFFKVILEAQGKAQKEYDVEDKTHLWVGKYLPNKCRITLSNNDSCCAALTEKIIRKLHKPQLCFYYARK